MEIITKIELQEYNKANVNIPMEVWVKDFRKSSSVKSERELIIEELTSKGIEFKGNAKTSYLKDLLEESK